MILNVNQMKQLEEAMRKLRWAQDEFSSIGLDWTVKLDFGSAPVSTEPKVFLVASVKLEQSKIHGIRMLRQLTGLGLKDSKDMIDRVLDPEQVPTRELLLSDITVGSLKSFLLNLASSTVDGSLDRDIAQSMFVVK